MVATPDGGDQGLTGSAQAEAARERMQDKSFKAWINMHISKDKLKVEDLTTDFGDGIKLIKLVENISDETLGKYHKNPAMSIQKIENINLPIKYINSFVASIGIKNTYSAENIIDQDKQFILGMVWTLILRFSINECSEGDMTAKEGLLQWAKKKVSEGSNGTVDVTNFHTSWQNGMAFNALINAFRPDLLKFEELKATNKLDNLNQAFDTAETHLGIHKILDSEDMVTMRPDEKSVMTYISLFWKEFAANKRKNVAGERITDVVRREQALEDLTAQYIRDAEALSGWAKGKLELFSKEADAPSSEEAELELKTFLNYGRTEKPKINGDLLQLQALASSLEMRLSALGRQFNPPAHTALPVMMATWANLTEKEIEYEDKLKARLKALKKIELLIKIFNSRATKHEEWMATKMAWLQVRQKILRVSVAEGENAPRLSVRRPSAPNGGGGGQSVRMSQGAQDGAARTSVRASSAGERKKSAGGSMLDKVGSFFGSSKNLTAEAGKGSSKNLTADQGQAVEERRSTMMSPAVHFVVEEVTELKQEKTFTRGKSFTGKGSVKMDALVNEAEKTAEAPDGGLDSAAKVQAKLNMFAAYEDELKGREAGVGKLTDLVGQATDAGCPPFRQFSLQTRVANISDTMEELKEAGKEYKEGLEVELQRQLRLEEMRVDYAKQSEALNRWVEDSIDMLTELVQASSVGEAEVEIATLAAFGGEMGTRQAALSSLAEFAQSMRDEGIVTNPYCRFPLSTMQEAMVAVAEAVAARDERLQGVLTAQKEFDAKKKIFADEVTSVAAKVSAEKAEVNTLCQSAGTVTDEPDSIAKGKEVLAAMEALTSISHRERRQGLIAPAQELNDWLVDAGELDNPYTREGVATLKSQVEVLEKELRDKITLLEAQITRAQADISPEQMAEVKKNFLQFDKSGDGTLIAAEFGAVLKNLDLELTPEEEEQQFTKFAAKHGSNDFISVDLSSFTTFMLQQFKAKDTVEALLEAFSLVAGGRDYIQAEDLHACLDKDTAAFLLSRMDGLDLGLDYKSFAHKVFGVMRNS